MPACRGCGGTIEPQHRYCPWCAAPQMFKAVAIFPPHPDVDVPGRGLRVSRYFAPEQGPPHTRLSIFDGDGRVGCVAAIDDRQTRRLSRFLAELTLGPSVGSIRDRVRRLRLPS